MDLLADEMPRWQEMATARQAAEVVLKVALADDELFIGCPHLALAVAAWAVGLAVSEESAPIAAWKILQAATETCGCTSRSPLQIVHRIHECWKRGAPQSQKLYTCVFSNVHGPGATRALDGLQLGWPWLRTRLVQGFVMRQA